MPLSSLPFLSKFRTFSPIWHALTPRRRRQILFLQILALIAGAGEVINLGALVPFLRVLSDPTEGLNSLGLNNTPFVSLSEQQLLFIFGSSFTIAVLISTLLRVASIRFQLRLGALIAADLGTQVYSSALIKPFPWHLENNTSSVIGHLTNDVNQTNGIIKSSLALLVNLSVVILLGGTLIVAAPLVMITASFLLSAFYIIIYRSVRQPLRASGKRLATNYQASLQVAQEGLGGIRDVILDRSQTFFINAYRNSNRTYRLAQAFNMAKAQEPRYLIEGFTVILIVLLSLSLALVGQDIESQLPLLGALALGTYRLLAPLQLCFKSFATFESNRASLERLRPFLSASAPKLEYVNISFPHFEMFNNAIPLLKIEEMSFRYQSDGPWVIENLNLEINAGERVAFVGTTGSGKSTITDLMLGFLTPTKGRILVHDMDLSQTPGLITAWQNRLAHVPQNIYLSDSDFAANIAFGVSDEHIDYEMVRRSAIKANISQLIDSSSNGYSTIVGERGVRLSGGQRQRIGLARALYKNSEFLVLDEATSALDNNTEAEVMSAIDELNRDLTIVIIAHRLSTVRRCDRIFLLQKGKVAGVGTFDQLLRDNSAFRALAKQRSDSNS
jgi:ABC-type multidrug transport system fused ATPase/permease subunit